MNEISVSYILNGGLKIYNCNSVYYFYYSEFRNLN
jgi:hypothetical protein